MIKREMICRGLCVEIVEDIKLIADDGVVIPYAIKASYDLYKSGYPIYYCVMPDAYTFGWLKKVLFYLRHGKYWYWDLYYSIYQIMRYSYKECMVVKKYKRLMYVSDSDVRLVKKICGGDKYFICRNGVNVGQQISSKKSFKDNLTLRVGVLSNWTKTSICEMMWFVEDIYLKSRFYDKIEVVVAGRCDDRELSAYLIGRKEIRYIGEVDSLSEFFNEIDVYVATVPKGVGVLNKVLDAFAYKKIVIGIRQCFSSFEDLANGYLVFRDEKDFDDIIAKIINGLIDIDKYVDNAYEYIKKNNDWDKNYSYLVDDVMSFVLSKDNSLV